MHNYHYELNMTIYTDTCRIHLSSTGQKRISLSGEFSKNVDLPLKTKLIIKYDTFEKILTVELLGSSQDKIGTSGK